MGVLRDVFRRRHRALMTIVGVATGVLALVVMGALMERTEVMLASSKQGMAHRVIVTDEKDPGWISMGADNPLPPNVVERVRAVEGVKRASRQVQLLLDDEAAMPIATIQAYDPPLQDTHEPGEPTVDRGRMLRSGERGKTVLGADIAKRMHAEVGETIEVRGRRYEVVGVLERTLHQFLDMYVIIPMPEAQAMYAATLPEAFREKLRERDIALMLDVVAKPGTDADELAGRIEREVDGVTGVGPTELRSAMEPGLAMFDVVMVAVGAIALLVGALAVVNTMLVAVTERVHEVGVKRALGASSLRIAGDVLTESAALSALGGLAGLAAGALMVLALNATTTSATLSEWFRLTPRLALGSVLFAAVLGVVGGLYPARYAARIDPIEALGHE